MHLKLSILHLLCSPLPHKYLRWLKPQCASRDATGGSAKWHLREFVWITLDQFNMLSGWHLYATLISSSSGTCVFFLGCVIFLGEAKKKTANKGTGIYNIYIYIFIISISSNFKWDKNTEWNQIRVSSILFSVFTLEKLSLNHHCCQRIRKRFTASHHNLTEKSVWVAHLANKPLKYLFLGFKQYPPATWFPNFKALPLFSNQADPSPVRELRRSQGLHEVFATRIVSEGFRRRFRRTTPAMRRFFQRLHLLPFSLLFSSLCIRITTIFGSNTIVKHAIRFQYRLRTNFQAKGWKEFIWLSIDIIQLISWGKCCEHRHGWEFLQNKIPRFFLWLLHHCTCHPVMSRLMIWKDVIIRLSSISDDSA